MSILVLLKNGAETYLSNLDKLGLKISNGITTASFATTSLSNRDHYSCVDRFGPCKLRCKLATRSVLSMQLCGIADKERSSEPVLGMDRKSAWIISM
jgi:hypothetical protein